MAATSVTIDKIFETTSITGTAKTRATMSYTDTNANEFEAASAATAGGTITSLSVIVGYGTSTPYTFTIPDRPTLVALANLYADMVAALDPDSDTTDEIVF